MLKVRSLKPTIILQFAIIIAPITLVLLYQALSDVRHADSVKFELQASRWPSSEGQLQSLPQRRGRRGRHGYPRQPGTASAGANGSVAARPPVLGSSFTRTLLNLIDTLRNAARGNPSVKELLPLRPVANRVNVLLTGLADSYDLREHANIENVALSVKRQVWIVLAATVITLVSAAGFVVLLIRDSPSPSTAR